MTGPEHYAKAEELLGKAEQFLQADEPSAARQAAALAGRPAHRGILAAEPQQSLQRRPSRS